MFGDLFLNDFDAYGIAALLVQDFPQQAFDHFHVQFLPLQRSPTKLKYLATMETGYGTFLADTAPEQMADDLRRCDPPTDPYSGA